MKIFIILIIAVLTSCGKTESSSSQHFENVESVYEFYSQQIEDINASHTMSNSDKQSNLLRLSNERSLHISKLSLK